MFEILIKNVITKLANRSRNPKGDTAWSAYQQGLLSKEEYESLKRPHIPTSVNVQEFLDFGKI